MKHAAKAPRSGARLLLSLVAQVNYIIVGSKDCEAVPRDIESLRFSHRGSEAI